MKRLDELTTVFEIVYCTTIPRHTHVYIYIHMLIISVFDIE